MQMGCSLLLMLENMKEIVIAEPSSVGGGRFGKALMSCNLSPPSPLTNMEIYYPQPFYFARDEALTLIKNLIATFPEGN